MKRAVFLDRDGTLIVEKDYLSRPEDVAMIAGTGKALKRLHEGGFELFILTNQSGVGRGYFTMADVEKVHEHIRRELARDAVQLRKIYVAPEAPHQPSRGRKPSPQFIFDARDEFGLDLAGSYVVGDKIIDLECGWNAAVRKSLLVRTGYGAEVEKGRPPGLDQAVIVEDIVAAANWIISDSAE
jgi:D-glycero-D-manno-heptose 1,7-bisphosphate phosphatase